MLANNWDFGVETNGAHNLESFFRFLFHDLNRVLQGAGRLISISQITGHCKEQAHIYLLGDFISTDKYG